MKPPIPRIASGFSAFMSRRAWTVPRGRRGDVLAFATALPPEERLCLDLDEPVAVAGDELLFESVGRPGKKRLSRPFPVNASATDMPGKYGPLSLPLQ